MSEEKVPLSIHVAASLIDGLFQYFHKEMADLSEEISGSLSYFENILKSLKITLDDARNSGDNERNSAMLYILNQIVFVERLVLFCREVKSRLGNVHLIKNDIKASSNVHDFYSSVRNSEGLGNMIEFVNDMVCYIEKFVSPSVFQFSLNDVVYSLDRKIIRELPVERGDVSFYSKLFHRLSFFAGEVRKLIQLVIPAIEQNFYG